MLGSKVLVNEIVDPLSGDKHIIKTLYKQGQSFSNEVVTTEGRNIQSSKISRKVINGVLTTVITSVDFLSKRQKY